MNNLIIVQQGRDLPQVLETYKHLPCDVVFCTAYTQGQLRYIINAVIKSTSYDNYLISSDDLFVNNDALAFVFEGLERHDVFTGYCRLTPYSPEVNLTKSPVRGSIPMKPKYEWFRLHELLGTRREVRTWFMGMSLSGMRRELWLEFPYNCYEGGKFHWQMSDVHLSGRLNEAGIEMYSDSWAKFDHLKAYERFIVGVIPPSVHLLKPNGDTRRLREVE